MLQNKNDQQVGGESSYLLVLLFSLLFMLLVVPAFEQGPLGRPLMHLGLTMVLISAAIATQRTRAVLLLGIAIVGVAVPTTWATMFFDHQSLFVFSCILESLFFFAMAAMIVLAVIQRHLASVHSVFGAISGYLLLGLAWSMLYLSLEVIEDESLYIAHRETYDHPIAGQQGVTVLSQLIYFSFVTMSTLGYGDIAPETKLARALTWTQSVTGLFYVAVLVAWLVSEIPPRDPSRSRKRQRERGRGGEGETCDTDPGQ